MNPWRPVQLSASFRMRSRTRSTVQERGGKIRDVLIAATRVAGIFGQQDKKLRRSRLKGMSSFAGFEPTVRTLSTDSSQRVVLQAVSPRLRASRVSRCNPACYPSSPDAREDTFLTEYASRLPKTLFHSILCQFSLSDRPDDSRRWLERMGSAK